MWMIDRLGASVESRDCELAVDRMFMFSLVVLLKDGISFKVLFHQAALADVMTESVSTEPRSSAPPRCAYISVTLGEECPSSF